MLKEALHRWPNQCRYWWERPWPMLTAGLVIGTLFGGLAVGPWA